MTDEIMKALDAYDKASKVFGSKAGKAGNGHEATYSQAYQRLVTLGVKPQLRKKYR